MANPKRCDICNLLITGKYIEYSNGLVVCEPCYQTKPKCHICDITIKGKYYEERGKTLCPDCFNEAKRCDCCKRLVLPEENYYTSEHYSGTFCKPCIENALRCDACGRPVRGEDCWSLGDGRVLCDKCKSKAIFDIKTANQLFEVTRNFLKSEFGIHIDLPVKLQFVRVDRLNQLIKEKSPDKRTNGLFMSKSKNNYYTVYMLYGLTESAFQGIAAHEYTHAWQAENCPSDQTKMLIEGFARWIQYQTYKRIRDFISMKEIEKDDDPIYGAGFKKIKEIYREKGYYGLLQYVKTQKA